MVCFLFVGKPLVIISGRQTNIILWNYDLRLVVNLSVSFSNIYRYKQPKEFSVYSCSLQLECGGGENSYFGEH
jgi:hypothetical protein